MKLNLIFGGIQIGIDEAYKFWPKIIIHAIYRSLIFVLFTFTPFEVIKAFVLFKSSEQNLWDYLSQTKTWQVLLFYFFLVLLVFLLYLPAHYFFQEKKKADKFTWNDISISTFIFDKSSPFSMGLKIINNKPYALENVSVELKYWLEKERKEGGSITNPENYLSWIVDGKREWGYQKIDGDEGCGLISFIEWKELNFFIELSLLEGPDLSFSPGSGQRLPKYFPFKVNYPGEYAYTLEINSKVDGMDLPPYLHKGELNLNYDGSDTISLF